MQNCLLLSKAGDEFDNKKCELIKLKNVRSDDVWQHIFHVRKTDKTTSWLCWRIANVKKRKKREVISLRKSSQLIKNRSLKSEVSYLTNHTKIWTRPQNRLIALRQFRPLILEPWCGRWSFWKGIKRAAFQFKYKVHDNVPWPEHYFCALFLTFRPLLTTPLCYFFLFKNSLSPPKNR